MKKFLTWFDNFILKHHRYRNWVKLYSVTEKSMVEYKCSICNKRLNAYD